MKIGVYLPDISPQSGGAFTFVETVLSGLATLKSDYEYHVFFYGTNKHLKSLSGENLFFHSLGKSGLLRFLQKIYYFYFAPIFQYLVFNINAKLKIKLHYPYSSRLDKACQKQGAHLMWFPTPQYEKVEGPYILTIWDLEHRAQPYFPEVSANGEWDGREKHFKSAIQRASYVVTGTNVGREEISQFYGVMKDRIKILPHPTPEFALKTNSKFNPPPLVGSDSFVFYPAQFWSHKNHVTLLEAISILKSKNKKINAVLVGSNKGNLQCIMDLVEKLNIKDQIIFPGFVKREELIALYQNALAMVYPSLCGPENLPPLEAMALGCPVIANNISGAKEQLGEAAFLVDCLKANEIANAILKLQESPDLRLEYIKRGKLRASQFTGKEFVSEFYKILEQFEKIRRLWA